MGEQPASKPKDPAKRAPRGAGTASSARAAKALAQRADRPADPTGGAAPVEPADKPAGRKKDKPSARKEAASVEAASTEKTAAGKAAAVKSAASKKATSERPTSKKAAAVKPATKKAAPVEAAAKKVAAVEPATSKKAVASRAAAKKAASAGPALKKAAPVKPAKTAPGSKKAAEVTLAPAEQAPAAKRAKPDKPAAVKKAAPGKAVAKKAAPAKAVAKKAATKAESVAKKAAPAKAAVKKAATKAKAEGKAGGVATAGPGAAKGAGRGGKGVGGKPESHAAMVRRARRINRELAEVYPYAHPELDFRNPFELLVATVLSAQTTDLRVNQTTPRLFAAYPTPEDLAAANPEDVEELIRPTGFFRAKTKSIMGLAAALRDEFGGEVPGRLADLVKLPGVGRKTANVVLGNAYGVPGITVDTHFGRLVRRFGWTEQDDPVKVEAEICEIFPKSEWTMLSHRVVFHGRRICHARKPACGACPIAPLCPSYGEGETDPEKARKLLKYEKGGLPGQRLSPPPDYPGLPAPPLGAG
ncbi:hypothetical protein GCM10010326_21310 [Streptomyces xanthochromogenes]|uniref:Endonuclease III n=1 Tax=Streptomyces xanthochromogenes TaxID=67384 RepID=A0ABQ2ZZI3_9ACTN|nr:hypothetical protein GCM10010326_21310 [Streptomyces xanthochromogenes]